ncbi:MAG: hypothetical protein Q9173_007299 [Seirophora scorigena]
MEYPDAHIPPDVEKNAGTVDISSRTTSAEKVSEPVAPIHIPPKLARWNQRIENLSGLEARGITRVLPEERHAASVLGYVQMALLWFSANITANNVAVGMLGPLLFELGFLLSAMCSIFGIFVGSAATAYMSIWGAQSGNRTMIVARYFMGYWPAKIACFSNMVLMVGYVGIVIVALVSWIVAVFGMAIFHVYEGWGWIPQLIVLFILVGSAGPSFDASLPNTVEGGAVTASRLSFFSLQLSVPVSWAATSSDFYVYYPESTKRPVVFLMTFTDLSLAFVFVNLIGIGLASGVATNPAWDAANQVSSGALILAGFDGLRGFGKFCGVIVALGVISNNIPGTYATALGCQVVGRYGKMVPRYLWVCVVVLVYFTRAAAGRDHLYAIFQNFLALMGYWVMIFVAIVVEEHLLFRRGRSTAGLRLDPRLPLGFAALIAFLAGWIGAIVGMHQTWYVGPMAAKAGGADIGTWLGVAFALVLFPRLRHVELKKFGR